MTPLWQPTTENKTRSHMQHFMSQVNAQYGLSIQDYDALYQWSIDQPESFWKTCATFCDIRFSQQPSQIIQSHPQMQKTKWFIDAKLNFAENLLIRQDAHIAVIGVNENGDTQKITYTDLFHKTKQLAKQLTALGVKPGDRVAGFVTNCIETVIAMLASTSIGAIWTACSPEFGVEGVLARFSQIEPTVLFVVSTHCYQGKTFSHVETIHALKQNLPTLKAVIDIHDMPYADNTAPNETIFKQLPFDHPVYILYSSGTTGKPKCMVHGCGRVLLQHKKELLLHTDLHQDDVIFFYTTCTWMMWHWLISSLSVGATLVLYDGSPFHPGKAALLDLIDRFDISIFGCGAKVFETYLKAQLTPNTTHRLQKLKTILTTGSPLIKESFDYIYTHVKKDVRVSSISGGSDLLSCFALGNPLLPVFEEELQCRGLGMAVEIFDENGQAVIDQPGELVCTKPFPSQPLYFWQDDTGEKYYHAYFDRFPNVWTQGDYAKLTNHQGLIIYGRSDTTLNPGGIRIGTSDIYEQVLKIEEILDCVAVGKQHHGDEEIILFVQLKSKKQLDEELRSRIKKIIREHLTPYHAPKQIVQIDDIPKTVNGKTMELLVKHIINGIPVKNIETLANPESLHAVRAFAMQQKNKSDGD